MNSAIERGALGFVAAAIAVPTFHQGMWELLHILSIDGLTMPAWYPMDPVPPLGVPKILNLCFWGGLYGIPFALLMRRFTLPLWLCGLILGFIAVLVGNFVVPAVKGLPVGGGWIALNWVRSAAINGCWGIGVGIIAPLLLPGSERR